MAVVIIEHARERMSRRGATRREVADTVLNGTPVKAKKGRKAREKTFGFGKKWLGKSYPHKKLKAVYVEEGEDLVVITVYVYYGKWEQ